MISAEHAREKLLEWHPFWNVDRFTDAQILVIYRKETIAMAEKIIKMYAENSRIV